MYIDGMSDKHSYAVLGAGKQGVAAAYDLILYGDASRVTLADGSGVLAKAGIIRLQRMLGSHIEKNKIALAHAEVNGARKYPLRHVIKGHEAVLSALPYYLNPAAAEAAISAGAHYADLGGHFDTTREILNLDAEAKKAGVTLIPDCGVSPGMCNSLAVCAMEKLSSVQDIVIYCGGLPQKPRPPLGYKLVFNLEGVLGNYFGKAYVLQDGKVKLAPAFSGREELDFGEPLGKLEAVVTGGATSTCPWTFRGKARNYVYKTLRYPGHYEKIQLLKDLGLLETTPVTVNGQEVVPRQVFVAMAGPRLHFPDDRDLLILKVVARGQKDGKKAEAVYEVLDHYDPKTGFTAMQRTTGFSAAVVLEMLAKGAIQARGVAPLEKSVPAKAFLEEIRRRGIEVKESVRAPEA